MSFVARTQSSICHFILHQKCLLYPGLKRETLWAHTLGLLNAPIQSEAVIVSESDLESETMAVDRGGGGEVKKEKKTRIAFCLPFLYRCNPPYTNMNSTIILVHRTTVHMRRWFHGLVFLILMKTNQSNCPPKKGPYCACDKIATPKKREKRSLSVGCRLRLGRVINNVPIQYVLKWNKSVHFGRHLRFTPTHNALRHKPRWRPVK